jgi:hypothetical protein
MFDFLKTVMKWIITWYTYGATALLTLLLGLLAYGHLSGSESVPTDFANKKSGAGFSLLTSNSIRDVSITKGSQGGIGANLRLVNVQGLSITPVQSTYFILVGSSKAPD